MASSYENSPRRTFIADADYRTSAATNDNDLTYRYCIVKFKSQTDKYIQLATSATDAIAGVLYNTPQAGDEADVILRSAQGTYKVKAGGTIHIGDMLTTDSASHAIATTSVGNVCIGQAMQEAVAGDVFEFMPAVFRYAATS